ncbi:heme peroxidase [Exidia glandulosa HHB12029]|uniref:Heme peroxidase n=1 Tax=Exidia glandulosa HHB12029 TaxID=1314781 RepID=A0A165M3Z2_EXIGL|nr:heme peroxidase [Exidia glandulosa HHB12029]
MFDTVSKIAASAYDAASQLTELAMLAQRPVLDDGKTDLHATALKALDTIERQVTLGLPLVPSTTAVSAIFDALTHATNRGIDDRKMLLEEVLIVLAKLPKESLLGQVLENNIVALFYKDLPHPPSTFLGRPPLLPPYSSMSSSSRSSSTTVSPSSSLFLNGKSKLNGNGSGPMNGAYGTSPATEGQATEHATPYPPPDVFSGKPYAHRMPDGSNNNPLFPDLGRAGMPYARSVAPTTPVPVSALPDAGVVFDVLLRRNNFKEHPSQISSMFFAFANIIIHSLFRTSRQQNTINDTSSYLDLSPLYGHNEEQQNNVRIKDGRGLMKEDTFADERLLMMPEATGALLVLFCRNHNYIARHILLINERQKFRQPEELASNQRAMEEQDDEIFNKARLVNCGYFMQVILGDYLSSILGTVREGSDWCLDPLQTIRTSSHELVPRGEGNVISVEFNLLYRWHATLSKQDEEWLTNDVFGHIFPGKSPDALTPRDFGMAVRSWMSKFSKDPGEWEFGSLKRQRDGKFRDEDLARVMKEATTNVAGAFGAQGVPPVLRVVEIMAIEEARSWGVCSLNEFRKFMGLKPYESFEEWNPDPNIHLPAMRLYGDIEHLELYVGLQAEETKSPRPGAGLCPGFTISRAILADAICLVRGDRFLTTDFTPFNLTSWGYQDCARDLNNGSMGGQLSKLLMRTLPDHFDDQSIYAHFPMLTPPAMQQILTKLGTKDKYNWEMNPNPTAIKVVESAVATKKVLETWRDFPTAYGPFMKDITKGYGMYLAWNDTLKHRRDRLLIRDSLFSPGRLDKYAKFYFDKTRELIMEKSFVFVQGDVRAVDIVRDVVNLVPVHWVSKHVAGLPLKTRDNPHGAHTETEVYQMCAVMFECVTDPSLQSLPSDLTIVLRFMFLNTRPVAGWSLRERSQKFSHLFLGEIKAHLEHIARGNFSIAGLRDSLMHLIVHQDDHAHDFLRTLYSMNTTASLDELAYTVLGTVVASVPNYGQAAAHVINFYLEEKHRAQKEHICRLALRVDDESDRLLTGYVLEALRLDPQTSGLFRSCASDTEVDQGDGTKLKVKKGERVFVSLAKANRDPAKFGPDNEHIIDPERPHSDYLLFGHGAQKLLGDEFVEKTMPQVIRAVFSKKNIRRAPGRSGQLNRFTIDWHGTPRHLYINSKGMITPWPESLVVQYDV